MLLELIIPGVRFIGTISYAFSRLLKIVYQFDVSISLPKVLSNKTGCAVEFPFSNSCCLQLI